MIQIILKGIEFQGETLVFFSSCCNGEVAEDFTLVSEVWNQNDPVLPASH